MISNAEFGVCVRQQSNLVDDSLKATQGYWHDCNAITSILHGFNGMVQPVQTASATILDVGANIGACSLPLAARGHTVVAFEPKRQHIDMIKASVASNTHFSGRIYLHEAGLADRATDDAELASEQGNSGNSWVLMKETASQSHVRTNAASIGGDPSHGVQVDDTVTLQRLDAFCDVKVDAVKIDAQGFEAAILAGAGRVLRHGTLKRLMLEFWPYGLEGHGVSPASLLQLLVDTGYALFAEDGARVVPATFWKFDATTRQPDAGRGFGHLFAFHESVVL